MAANLNLRVAVFAVALAGACADVHDLAGPELDGGFEPITSGSSDAATTGTPGPIGVGAAKDAGHPFPVHDAAANANGGAPGLTGHDAATYAGPTHDAATAEDAGADAGGSIGTDAGGPGGGSTCDTLTYASFGQQFMSTYCVRCHTGFFAQHRVQLDSLAGVQMNKSAIKQVAVDGTTMPTQSPLPSSAEREQLGQWLDCGPN